MPELPEVETVRRGLEPVLSGKRIDRLEQRRPDLRFPFPKRFAKRVAGCRIEQLARRAKYLIARFDSGEALIMHLGMSGRYLIEKPGEEAKPVPVATHRPQHDHVVFHTEDGATVTYNDPRRFGFMVMCAGDDLDQHPLLRDLGPEPLGNAMNAAHLAKRAAGRKNDLKAFLMDQRNVAGLGNIYVCEALFRAGLSPKRVASCLARRSGTPTVRAERLAPAIRATIADAIAAGGSSLRDYRQADGALGYFQHSFSVYGREGQACIKPTCNGTVKRIVQSGRSTFYCPSCQS
ncbi:MAG: bifunctional DNA-formamidopyrimidine glycosylase/DNA-(apurinic or apyrimidinic site) lyase [Filomicrobium sp.]